MSKAIKDIIQHQVSQELRQDSWTNLQVHYETEQTATDEMRGFGYINSYRTELKLGLITFCNDAQWRGGAQERVEHDLMHELYRDQKELIRPILRAIEGRDAETATRLVIELQRSMTL